MEFYLQLHEEIVKKRESISALRKELQTLIEEWFTLENVLRPELTAKYDALFGELEIEIQRKALEAADIGRRAELLAMKRQRGEVITSEIIQLVNTIVDNEFKKFRQRLYNDLEEQHNIQKNSSASKPSDDDIPKMYRTIVKKLHPDVSDATDNFQKYWNVAQNAFETKNATQLRALYIVLAGDDLSKDNGHFRSSDDEFAELERQELDIRQKVEIERRKILRLWAEEPFTFENELDKKTWIDERKNFLRGQIEQKERDIIRSNELFFELTGSKFVSETEASADGNKKSRPFSDDDFFDNTYFGGR